MNNNDFFVFSKVALAGLFIGVIDSVLLLAFNIFYRDYTGYAPSELINVSSIIFSVNLILLETGMVCFLFVKAFGKKDLFFILPFLLLTIYLSYQTEHLHRFSDATINAQFKGLLLGVVLVTGISSLAIPALSRSRFFEKHVY